MQMRKVVLISIVFIIIGFLLGSAFMYLVDSAWVDETRRSNQNKLNRTRLDYSDVLKISQAMVSNCYEAFYVVSKCSTKGGCSFESTINKLTKLNLERKNFKLQLDQLLEGNNVMWSKDPIL